MKKKNSKKLRVGRKTMPLGRYLAGASLLACGLNAHADGGMTPEQFYEGGTNTYSNWIELSAGGLLTQGYKAGAEQRDGHNAGVFGGIEDLHYRTNVATNTTLTIDGHSIFDDHDYQVGLALKREDLGYVRLNFENFRTWYPGSGGFLPEDGTAFALPGDALALDRGLISLELGLTKKDEPQIIFKYTHSYRDGDKSSTLWGPVHDAGGNLRRVFPTVMGVDETVDTFQLDLTHRYKKIDYGAGVSYQFAEANDSHQLSFYPGEPVQQKATDQQGVSSDLESVHAFAESWLKSDLFLSTGFLFANLDDSFTGSRIYGDDFDVVYSPAYPALGMGYFDLDGGAHKNEYVFNLNLMSLPTKNLTITPSLRAQWEDWNADSSGMGTLGTGEQQQFTDSSGRESLDVTERLEARYIGVTNWVFNLGGEWTEGQGNLHENGGLTQVNGFGPAPVRFATDDSRLFQKYYASARWYPLARTSVDLGGYYKNNRYDYNFTQDSTPNNFSGGEVYPGFLVYQGFETTDGYLRVSLHPWNKIMLVSRYEYQLSTIQTEPDPASGLGQVESSQMHSHIIGQNASWTPLNWLCLQAGFNYVLSETKTPASDYTQSILNSQNNYWTLNFNSGFVLDEKTDLNIGYFYYRADDYQPPVGGVPFGAGAEEHSVTATLTRRLTEHLRWSLKYAFAHYEDSAAGGHFDYDAHVIFSSLQYRF
ncbi:MAG TPA: hypothetical protein VFV81_00320 [Verrucomicrobiae bacterium]|nr:hypothetical protein [Verrucomicrobiae bacterium]